MKINFKPPILSILFAFTTGANASANSGPRTIEQIGCHLEDGTCYVYIDGEAVGPSNCSSISIRWNKDAANTGKEALSLLMTAFAADKKVNFRISDSCYGTSYPTFDFINIYK